MGVRPTHHQHIDRVTQWGEERQRATIGDHQPKHTRISANGLRRMDSYRREDQRQSAKLEEKRLKIEKKQELTRNFFIVIGLIVFAVAVFGVVKFTKRRR